VAVAQLPLSWEFKYTTYLAIGHVFLCTTTYSIVIVIGGADREQ
jgi:hypothetical protein